MNKEFDVRISRTMVIEWLSMCGVLFVGYFFEMLLGNYSVKYFVLYTLIDAVPAAIIAIMYFKGKTIKYIRSLVIFSFVITYAFSMFTSHTDVVFVFILPLIFVMVLFHQPGFIIRTGIIVILINLATELYHIYAWGLDHKQAADYETQFALIFFCFIPAYIVARIYNDIEADYDKVNQKFKKKNSELMMKAMQMENMTNSAIFAIASTIDAKDEYTRGHSKRVAEYSVALAGKLGLPWMQFNTIRNCALLHDLGKIGVPDIVLCKPGRLTDEEFMLMRNHTVIGAEILEKFESMENLPIGARYHHERWDGKGYPEGLAGEDIPYIARIIGICDAFDAMTSTRVYRKSLSREEVIDEIERGAGVQFDPEIAKVFVQMLRDNALKVFDDEDDFTVAAVMDKKKEASQPASVPAAAQTSLNQQLDPLTALYTKEKGEELIRELIKSTYGAFMIFHIDNMRQVNEHVGFVKGDYLIQEMARVIVDLDTDLTICRYSGSSIAVFMKYVLETKQMESIVSRFFEAMEAYRQKYPEHAQVTFSVGVAHSHDYRDNYTQLALSAEKALYHACQFEEDRFIIYNDAKRPASGDHNAYKIDLHQFFDYLGLDEVHKLIIEARYTNYVGLRSYLEQLNVPTEKLNFTLFTLVPAYMESVDASQWELASSTFQKAAEYIINDSDACLLFSSTQRLVIMTKRSKDELEKTAEMIVKNFYKMYGKDYFSLHYDQAFYKPKAE